MTLQRLALVLFTSCLACTGWAAPPDTPTGLRIAIYSSSTAELFWQRPGTPRLHYEVSRDETLLAETDGVSLMDRTFIRGSNHQYAVVAINEDGERSNPATLAVDDPSVPDDNPPPANPPPDSDSAPANPAGLRIDIYSPKSAELFWERPSTPGLLYDLFKDSVLLTQTDGVSFFDRNFDNSRITRYEVVAIGKGGARSGPSTIVAGEEGEPLPPVNPGPGPKPDPDVDPPTSSGKPTAPAQARVDVYSSTSAELFWERPLASERVVSTEILRDGQLLGSTEGTSFYDNTRNEGQEYLYTLTAINADGKRSDPTIISFEPDRLFINDTQAVLAMLQLIIQVNGNVEALPELRNLVLRGDSPPIDRTVGQPVPMTRGDGVFIIRTPVTCNQGGSYTIDSIDGGPMTSVTIDNCTLGDGLATVYDGSFFFLPADTGTTITYENFSITGNFFGLTIHQGEAKRFTFKGENTTLETLTDFSFTQQSQADRIVVENMSLKMVDASDELPRTSLEVSFDFSSGATGPRTLSVSTLDIFQDNDFGPGYTSGRLLVDDKAGTSMQVDAGKGSRNQFKLSTYSAIGSGSSELNRWGSSFFLPCISVDAPRAVPLANCQQYPPTSIP